MKSLEIRIHICRYRSQAHQFSLLCVDGVAELEQRLELVVLGESDNFHDRPKLTEDLSEDQSG